MAKYLLRRYGTKYGLSLLLRNLLDLFPVYAKDDLKLRGQFVMKQCVFIIDDRTQSMPIQSVVDVEAISSSTCIISTAPAADVLDTA
uniref:Uncharacterized protein n=1 Tax=Rhodnius prolixus TaxID=13249 RepID=T1HQD5_RHOPR